jgi:hypothetical protein
MKFRLYWLDTRNGNDYPALDYPEAMEFPVALQIIKSRPRHSKDSCLELHYEPLSLSGRFTSLRPAI